MNSWRMIVVSTALVPIIIIAASGCSQQQPSLLRLGKCYQQAACVGGSSGWLLERDTLNECKEAGGKSWVDIIGKSCTSF
jgi:hypothetical protein